MVENDVAPMTANIGDGNPLGVYMKERVGVGVGWAGFGKAGEYPLENFYWEAVDGVRGPRYR